MFSDEVLKGGEEVLDIPSDDPLRYLNNLFFYPILFVMEVLTFTGSITDKSSMILLEEV